MAERQRLRLVKSRRRDPHAWDYNTFALIDGTGTAVLTEASLAEIEQRLTGGRS
jgi:hypothetical protein